MDPNNTEVSPRLPLLNPGQQRHLNSLTYRNLTQLDTYDKYLNNSQDDFLQ